MAASHQICSVIGGFLAALVLHLSLSPARAEDTNLRDFERQVLRELNRLRENPAAFAADIKALKSRYHGKELRLGDRKNVVYPSREGWKAAAEAIKVLKKTKPRSRLLEAEALSRAAKELQKDQAETGDFGHEGADGSDATARVARYGKSKAVSECVAYGDYQEVGALFVVIQLLLDDGFADRQHRKKLLDPSFTDVGIACGSHPKIGQSCVIDFAEDFVPN